MLRIAVTDDASNVMTYVYYSTSGTNAGRLHYTQNDLSNKVYHEVAKASPISGDKKLVNLYDYRGRRVQKTVYTHNGSTWGSPIATYRYQHCDALIVVERDGSNNALRKYTWGLDILGQQGAASRFTGGGLDAQLGGAGGIGGIGGLLAVEESFGTTSTTDDKNYLYCYDGNGNVGQVIDSADGSLDATHEYDPYGRITASSGTYAAINPVRFSTKYWDDETGLGYWGYRYYDPKLGRWISRDPIGEAGDTLVYRALANSPGGIIDAPGEVFLPTGPRRRPRFDPTGNPPPNPNAWRYRCANPPLVPRANPLACKYGASAYFEATIALDYRCEYWGIVPDSGVGGVAARLLPTACKHAIAWPLDCVCRTMGDSADDQCVRGCLLCIRTNTGLSPDTDQHDWCIARCVPISRRLEFYKTLDSAIKTCVLGPEGCYLFQGTTRAHPIAKPAACAPWPTACCSCCRP